MLLYDLSLWNYYLIAELSALREGRWRFYSLVNRKGYLSIWGRRGFFSLFSLNFLYYRASL